MKVQFNKEIELFAVVNENGEEIEYFADRKEAADFLQEIKNEEKYSTGRDVVQVHGNSYGFNEETTNEVDDTAETTEVVENKEEFETTVTIDVQVADYKRKSDVVREAIKQVKQQHGAMTQVVEFAVTNLGMTKQLAKTYTKNNWDKV
jgi:uncharacterized protein related to proFAR isomerase